MTIIDPSTVATMQGRELDIALHRAIRPLRSMWCPKHGVCWGPHIVEGKHIENDCGLAVVEWDHDVPHCSTDPAAFFAMMEAVRAKGWQVRMHIHAAEPDGIVAINDPAAEVKLSCLRNWHRVDATADTLPLAFARAALLACLTEPAK